MPRARSLVVLVAWRAKKCLGWIPKHVQGLPLRRGLTDYEKRTEIESESGPQHS